LSVLLDLFYFILVTKLNYWQMFILVLFLFSSNIYGPWDEAVIKEWWKRGKKLVSCIRLHGYKSEFQIQSQIELSNMTVNWFANSYWSW